MYIVDFEGLFEGFQESGPNNCRTPVSEHHLENKLVAAEPDDFKEFDRCVHMGCGIAVLHNLR